MWKVRYFMLCYFRWRWTARVAVLEGGHSLLLVFGPGWPKHDCPLHVDTMFDTTRTGIITRIITNARFANNDIATHTLPVHPHWCNKLGRWTYGL